MNDRERAICERVRSFRKAIRWPQGHFAKEFGITRDKLASVEYGRTPVHYRTGIALCKAFDLSPAWLVTGEGQIYGYPAVLLTNGQRQVLNDTDLLSAVYDLYPGDFKARQPSEIKDLAGHPPESYLAGAVKVWFTNFEFTPQSGAEDFVLKVVQFAKRLLHEGQHGGSVIRKFKIPLTHVTVSGNLTPVKSPMAGLRERLNKATRERGMKSKLAKTMGVPLANVSQWLSGEREPGGETTLRLLSWVEQQEQKA